MKDDCLTLFSVWEAEANKTFKFKYRHTSVGTELGYSHLLWENAPIPVPKYIHVVLPLRDTGTPRICFVTLRPVQTKYCKFVRNMVEAIFIEKHCSTYSSL
jgi:hypothetical protein